MIGADEIRRCRVDRNARPVTPDLEANCKRHIREPGSDDAVPPWYWGAWHVAGEGRGD